MDKIVDVVRSYNEIYHLGITDKILEESLKVRMQKFVLAPRNNPQGPNNPQQPIEECRNQNSYDSLPVTLDCARVCLYMCARLRVLVCKLCMLMYNCAKP